MIFATYQRMRAKGTSRAGPSHQLADCAASRPYQFFHGVVRYFPCQVRPVVVMRELSIYLLQQQVRPGRGEALQVCAFVHGGG